MRVTARPPGADEVRARARAVLEAHWRRAGDGGPGWCVPNPTTYPHLWLWDSCFHAVTWAALGDERAVEELAACLVDVGDEGFVPHMRYGADPAAAEAFWGTAGTSSITQPPVHGHAVAELARRGVDVPDAVVEASTRALRGLLATRSRGPTGLLAVVHPWETGCDDSPRWDAWRADPHDPVEWRATKGRLLRTVERTPAGTPRRNPAFACAPVSFSALVAWSARELVTVTGDERLAAAADELAGAVEARWDPDRRTWVDDGAGPVGARPGPTGPPASGAADVVEALLPALLGGALAADAVERLVDPTAFGAPFGPRGTSVADPAFEATTYWRGPAWPQLGYLSALAADAAGRPSVASSVRTSTVSGAWRSGWAEYWDADDGSGLGAVPQSWTGLAAVLVERAGPPAG